MAPENGPATEIKKNGDEARKEKIKHTSSKTHPKKMTTTWRSENQKKVAYVLHLQIDNFFKIVEKQMGPDYLDDIYFASHVIQALATQKNSALHAFDGSCGFHDYVRHSLLMWTGQIFWFFTTLCHFCAPVWE